MAEIDNLLDQLPEAYICWKDKESRFLGCNENFATLLGKSKEEIIGTKDTVEKHVRDDQEVLETLQPKIHMLESIKDGSDKTLHILTNKGLLRDSNGQVIGILVVFTKVF